jgi:SAM-dependent methyltransferase
VEHREPVERIHAQEREFHDHWAAGVRVEEIGVRQAFEALTALENRFILKCMGDLRGKRVLDLGAGLGESSVYFALHGAEVTLADLSPAMVDFALRLARHHGVSVTGIVCPAESLQVPENHFDFVYVANLLHHVTDKDRVFAAAVRALKVGGRFFSWDPLAYNPAINVYRRLASQVRSEDEHPLTFRDIETASRHLCKVGHREFWIAGLLLFVKYYVLDRVNPNEDRYWKRILNETPATLWWWYPLQKLDEVLTRLPLVRRLAWNMVLWGEKSS